MEEKQKTRKLYKKFIKALREEKRRLPQIVSQLNDQKSFLQWCASMYEQGQIIFLHDVVQNLTIWDNEMALEYLTPALLSFLDNDNTLQGEITLTYERLKLLASSLENEVNVIHPMTELFDNVQLYYSHNMVIEYRLLSIVNELNEKFIANFNQRIKNYGVLNV